MPRVLSKILVLLLLACAPLYAADAELPKVTVEDGKVYRRVNGEPITGKDVLDLLLDNDWEQSLHLFIDYALCAEDIRAGGITVSEAEIEEELQILVKKFAERRHLPPNSIKLEDILKDKGNNADIETMRRDTRVNVGMLKLFQKSGKLAKAHISDQEFIDASQRHLENLAKQKGIVVDPKQLEKNEVVRVGGHSYSRDEVREYLFPAMRKMPEETLARMVETIVLERCVERGLKEKKLELTDEDLQFHYSFLCHLAEEQTGAPGGVVMRQEMEKKGYTSIEEYVHSRTFKIDAGITRLAKIGIGYQQLKEEFKAHPERYRVSDNLIAHIFVRVLDPDGRPYTENWRSAGHRAITDYVQQKREEQFAKYKPKIEGLIPLAKEDFAGTAKKYSEDSPSTAVGGEIGRIGKTTILTPPLDNEVRAAAVKLKPGEISAPVRSNFGWHLLKCLDKQEVTLDESSTRIYLFLIHQAKESIANGLINSAKIEDH